MKQEELDFLQLLQNHPLKGAATHMLFLLVSSEAGEKRLEIIRALEKQRLVKITGPKANEIHSKSYVDFCLDHLNDSGHQYDDTRIRLTLRGHLAACIAEPDPPPDRKPAPRYDAPPPC
jgi:hypothetical protein